ncbi:MAG: CHAT domain-containing protein [Spirochaetia bacterium]|nr:CHAT domain-containing protein [Spirochaetia bacterium]
MSINEQPLITVIVDRVGNTNIFNIIKDNLIDNPFLEDIQDMQSVVDDDLIEEFIEELHYVAQLARSVSTMPPENEEKQAAVFQNLKLNKKLKEIGEAFFRQFFPEAIQKLFQRLENAYLFFHIDSKLASLPLEILHDGDSFLWQKFYLGKSVKGQHSSFGNILAKETVNMLIIADPTEDLEWARIEGENLFEHLSSNFPEKKLNIELTGGKQITKLNLLNFIKNKDIIHYCGHLHYTSATSENGWILYGNKIARAREIQLSGASPTLIFSNSCISGRDIAKDEHGKEWYSNFASSFLKTGKTNYIGTIWEVPDNRQTIDFTIRFYNEILKGEPLGVALQKSRHFAWENFHSTDLTWAGYLLMGNPSVKIFETKSKTPDITKNILDNNIVLHEYPFPIAESYKDFLDAEKEKKSPSILLNHLFECASNVIFIFAAIVIQNFRYLKLSKPVLFEYPDLKKTLDSIFSALRHMNTMKIYPVVNNLAETLYMQKESLYKIAKLREEIESKNNPIKDDLIESYQITVQYFLELILMEIEFLKNYGFYKITEPGSRQLSLAGLIENHKIKDIILPTQQNLISEEEILKKTSDLVGNLVFYNPVKKIFLDLSSYMDIDITTSKDKKYSIQYFSDKKDAKIIKQNLKYTNIKN